MRKERIEPCRKNAVLEFEIFCLSLAMDREYRTSFFPNGKHQKPESMKYGIPITHASNAKINKIIYFVKQKIY